MGSLREVKYQQRPGFRRHTRLQDSIKNEVILIREGSLIRQMDPLIFTDQ